MELTAYQIIAPLFSIFAIVYAWNLALRQKKTIWEAAFWTFFWGLVALIALYPSFLTYLSALTGIQSHENAVLVTFMGILFFMVFYIVIRVEELEQQHAKLLRLIALKEAGLSKDDSEKK
jgi:hypothetical protein